MSANVSMTSLQWQLEDLREDQQEFQKQTKDQQKVNKEQRKLKQEFSDGSSAVKGQKDGQEGMPKSPFMALMMAMAMGFDDQLNQMSSQASQMQALTPEMNSLNNQLNTVNTEGVSKSSNPEKIMEAAQISSATMDILDQKIGNVGLQEQQFGQQISMGAGQIEASASTEDQLFAMLSRTQKMVK